MSAPVLTTNRKQRRAAEREDKYLFKAIAPIENGFIEELFEDNCFSYTDSFKELNEQFVETATKYNNNSKHKVAIQADWFENEYQPLETPFKCQIRFARLLNR